MADSRTIDTLVIDSLDTYRFHLRFEITLEDNFHAYECVTTTLGICEMQFGGASASE